MGFRGCDEKFARAVDYVSRHPGELKLYVDAIIRADEKRRAQIISKSDGFFERYNIRYCPFHSGTLIKGVRERNVSLEVAGEEYDFNVADCSAWKFCNTPFSFDSELIEALKNFPLKEVGISKRFNSCATCGDSRGQAFFVGYMPPSRDDISFRTHRRYSNDKPIYLFERPCGHDSVTIQSSAAPEFRLK